MQLGSANSLFLLAFAEALAIGFLWLGFWRRRASSRFGGERAASAGSAAFWARATFVVVAATLAVIAMARPQWGSREFSRQQEGVDVVIALDISQSMTATDVSPTRLGLAQAELRDLLDGMRGNRIGLVFFAGSAILRSPLSTDSQAIAQIVTHADREPGLTRAGSDLGAALEQAGRILDASDSPGKAVIIVSDGEDHVGNAASKATELAGRGIAVFAAGVGTPQGSTLLERVGAGPQTRVKLDASGRPVISRLEESKLQSVAGAGGGRYLRLDGGQRLLSLRDDLNQLQQTPLAEQTQRVPIERFQFVVAAALIVLALAWFVPEMLPPLSLRPIAALRPRPGLALLLLAMIVGGACADADPARSGNKEANRLYQAGEYEQALAMYEELLAQRPDLPELAYNAGNALHRLGRFDRAVEETRRALPPTTVELGAATYYALGNHYFALEDYESAYEAYKSALLLDPDDADAKWNIEIVLILLNQQPIPLADQQQPAGNQPQETPPGQEPSDQSGQPSPGQAGDQPAQPSGSDAPSQPSQADVQRALEEALAGIDQDFSFEDAIEILDLLRQRLETPRQAPGSAPAGGLDY